MIGSQEAGNTKSPALDAGDGRPRPDQWAPRLERLLGRQRTLCRGLDALSERQGALVGEGDTDGLLVVLGERQGLIDEITAVRGEIEPFHAQWDALMGQLAAPRRAAIEALVREIALLIESVGRRDDADRAGLEARRAAVAEELAGVGRGVGAVAAYGPAGAGGRDGAAGEPRFQDRRC